MRCKTGSPGSLRAALRGTWAHNSDKHHRPHSILGHHTVALLEKQSHFSGGFQIDNQPYQRTWGPHPSNATHNQRQAMCGNPGVHRRTASCPDGRQQTVEIRRLPPRGSNPVHIPGQAGPRTSQHNHIQCKGTARVQEGVGGRCRAHSEPTMQDVMSQDMPKLGRRRPHPRDLAQLFHMAHPPQAATRKVGRQSQDSLQRARAILYCKQPAKRRVNQ